MVNRFKLLDAYLLWLTEMLLFKLVIVYVFFSRSYYEVSLISIRYFVWFLVIVDFDGSFGWKILY